MPIIKPDIVHGVIARNCHPGGCRELLHSNIEQVKAAKPIVNGPKKVLLLGGSSGLGLSSRISLAFGAKADTVNVSYEQGPSDKGGGSTGWHNNIAFKEFAEAEGLIAKDFIGDAFDPAMREQVINFIKDEFGGSVDCVIYSLATGVRPKPDGGVWRSVIKPIGNAFTGNFISFVPEVMNMLTLEPASEQEQQDTIKVMGGEDWKDWITTLKEAGVLADGVKVVAYSYIGAEITAPVYYSGTLGGAKKDLNKTADELDAYLKDIDGDAYVAVCKALVTKASVFIPGLSSYMIALLKVFKQRGEQESIVLHLHRIMTDFLYNPDGTPTDAERLIRADNFELNPEVQKEVAALLELINPDTFTDPDVADFAGFRKEFMQINGFEIEGVDYDKPYPDNR